MPVMNSSAPCWALCRPLQIPDQSGAVTGWFSPYHRHSAARRSLVQEEGVFVHDGLSVVADASLYYREELRRALGASAQIRSREAGAAQLILAAYQAWGASCAIVSGRLGIHCLDSARQRALCARDFTGRRPLHSDSIGEASSSPARFRDPRPSGVPERSLLTSIAESMSGFLRRVTRPAMGHRQLAPGHTCSGSVREDDPEALESDSGRGAAMVCRSRKPRFNLHGF